MNKDVQLEELDSLKSIYYNEELQVMEDFDGKTQVIFWAFCKPGDNFVVKYLESLNSPEPKSMEIKHLPPIELKLTLPEDYPTKNPPEFIISCQWLHKPKISLLCKKLDDIWSEYGCVEILYAWCDFLKNESLIFLGFENELDLTELCTKHLLFMKKLQYNAENKRKWLEKKGIEIRENMPKNVNSLNVSKIVSKKECGSEKNSDSDDKKDETASSNKGNKKRFREDRYKLGEWYPYCRRNQYRGKNSGYRPNSSTTRYDARAVLNLSLKVSPIKVLESYSAQRENFEFLRNYYTCNICFCDKMGKDCTKFQSCNHVFCINCIKSYFTIKINDGSVLSIKCPDEKCTTEALPSQIKDIVSEELFAKYDSLLLSITLDTMSDIIYCPRQTCQYPVSWDPEEKMASCPNCQYVFCVTCKMTYHGIQPCQCKPEEARRIVEQYENGTTEEKLQMETKYGKKHLESLVNNSKSEAWIKDNSKSCPKCEAAIERSYGCNKMVCWKCNTPFCWLCGTLLDPKNPYSHYNDPRSHCENKLFYLVHNFDEEDDEAEWDWILDYIDGADFRELDDLYFHFDEIEL